MVSEKGKGDGDWIELYNAKGEDAGMVRARPSQRAVRGQSAESPLTVRRQPADGQRAV